MRLAVLLALFSLPAGLAVAQGGRAQPPAAQVADPIAEAYAQFLLAHRLEDDDEIDDAIAAYRRAMSLDPGAADIPADLADMFMRQNRGPEAIAAADQALKIDPDNREAHRVLGTIYGSMAVTSEGQRTSRQTQRENLARAIHHLEQAAVRPLSGGTVDANLRAMLARMYVANGDNDQAIPVLAELVKQEPGWQDGALLLVEAYTGAGRGDEAIAWLESAAPDNPSLYSTLGTLYERARRWRDAASAYEKSPQFARSADIRLRYASMLLNSGGHDYALRARDTLREVVRTAKSPDARSLLLLAQAERAAGDYEAAEATARRVIGLNTRDPRGHLALAEALAERRRYPDVIQALAPVVSQFRAAADPAPALSLLLPHLGFAYQQVGQLEQAIAAFAEARKLAPRDAALTGYLIQAHLAAKNFDEAALLARAARAERPGDLRLTLFEAQALTQSGRTNEAVALVEDVVKLQSGNPAAHIALAQVYTEANRGPQAVKVLQDAQTRFPGDTDITFQLGAVFEQQKRYAEAESAFRQIIASDPEHAAALNYLGYMLADRGERLTESLDFIKRALEIEPDNGSYLDSLGWAYFREGKLDLAEQHLKRAADQLTTNSVVQDHYGDVLLGLGRVDEAIAAWTRALEGDGDSIDRDTVDRKIRNARDQLPRR